MKNTNYKNIKDGDLVLHQGKNGWVYRLKESINDEIPLCTFTPVSAEKSYEVPVDELWFRKLEPKQLMLLYFTSGDEIHISITNFSAYEKIEKLMEKNKFKELMEYVYEELIIDESFQSYAPENWNFEKYNIKKVLHLPELGC